MVVSEKLRAAVKLSPLKSYEIAHKCNLHPSTLSQIVNGIVRVKPGDPRVEAIAKLLGLKPEDCFDARS